MSLLPVFKSLETTPLGVYLHKSTYAFPAIEVVHVLGLTLLLGTVLVVNLRLLGLGMRRQSPPEVARLIGPLFWIGFGVTVASGATLFLGEAVKCYFNEAFVWKMGLLVAATVFHVTLHRRLSRSEDTGPAAARAVAVLSLSLWFGVGVAGRTIGFI